MKKLLTDELLNKCIKLRVEDELELSVISARTGVSVNTLRVKFYELGVTKGQRKQEVQNANS
jgi:hypothetical protein